MQGLDAFRFATATFTLLPQKETLLPPFLGSTLRGAFGHALHRSGCPMHCGKPQECSVRMICPYAYCFESPPPPDSERLRKNSSLPRPILFEPPPFHPKPWMPNEPLRFGLVIVGRGLDFFPALATAVHQSALAGLGRERSPFTLASVTASRGPQSGSPLWDLQDGYHTPLEPLGLDLLLPAFPPSDQIRLFFLTPLRLLRDKSLVRSLSFRDFARDLLGRLSSLLFFHCKTELAIDFKGLLEEAAHVQTLSSSLQVFALQRHSDRQDRDIALDGLVGEVVWQGSAVRTLWPFLVAGTLTHVGKSTILGLGRYAILPV